MIRDALDLYDLPFYNDSGETIPAYAIFQIGSGWTDANARDYFNAAKPNGSGKKFLINGPLSIPSTSDGMASDRPGVYVQYSGSTPTAGQEWGPVAGSWAISSSGTGYLIVGDATTVGGVLVVRVASIAATNATVYEFRNCENTSRRLYLDNSEIGEHEAGEVAVIRIDGLIECWQLFGPAPQCKTGSCAEILSWGANCDACSVCFTLTPCGGGSPTFVRGIEWWEYEGRVVKLDGPGHEGCYTVAVADGCFDVDEALGVEHITDDYANCDGCGCYELENCADSGDVIYASGDLASVVGAASGVASLGKFVKRRGVCYEITGFANPCGTTPQEWDVDEVEEIASCSGCCWLLTPCPDQDGDPDPEYYRLDSDDPDLTAFVNEDGTSNGRVLRLAGICYSVSIPATCPDEGVILGLPTVEEEYDSCEDCIPSCWERCDAAGTYLYTYSDMKEVGPDAAVKRAEDGHCYKRATLSECDGDTLVVFTIETIIDEGTDSCTICQTPRVKLVASCGSEGCSDCSGSSSGGSGSGSAAIVTDDEAFFSHVGKYVKVDGECRIVEWTTDSLAGTVECWTGPYSSCAACASAPSQRTFVVKDGDGFKGVTIQGVFTICGEVDVTDDCPNATVNAYALASIL